MTNDTAKIMIDRLKKILAKNHNTPAIERIKAGIQKRKQAINSSIHEFTRIDIPISKCRLSDKYINDKKLRIYIHEDYCPKHYFNSDYKEKKINWPDGNYYEFTFERNLFVKKNIRVEDYVKNALEKRGINSNRTISQYVVKSILDAQYFFPKLFEHKGYLPKQITVYIRMDLYLILLRKHFPEKNFSKIIRNMLYRSLGFVKTFDVDVRPKEGGNKNVA